MAEDKCTGMFAVVNFYEENEVEVVPLKWVTGPDGDKKCWWPMPEFFTLAKTTQLVKKQKDPEAEPEDGWTSYKARIMYTTGRWSSYFNFNVEPLKIITECYCYCDKLTFSIATTVIGNVTNLTFFFSHQRSSLANFVVIFTNFVPWLTLAVI
jgi:hypothetical protein